MMMSMVVPLLFLATNIDDHEYGKRKSWCGNNRISHIAPYTLLAYMDRYWVLENLTGTARQ